MPSVYRSVLSALAITTLAGAPLSARAGVHYGDPVPGHARSDSTLMIFNWTLPVYEIVLTPCGGGSVTHHVLQIDLSPTVGLTAPIGSWCGVTIVPDGDFTLTGLTPDSYDLDITLEVGDIDLNQGNALNIVSGTTTDAALIELLGVDWWDNQVAPYVGTGADVIIDSSHARHAALCGSMENASSLAVTPL